MLDEKAVEAGQSGQAPQLYSYHANVGYFAPNQLDDLAKQGRLYLIADAVSGTASGQIAGEYAIKKVIHSFYTSDHANLQERLLAAIQQANTDIFEENKRHPERRPMATTLSAAWIHGNKLLVANVGDNRAYVVWNQDIELLSQEISLAALNEEANKNQAEPATEKPLPAQAAAPAPDKPEKKEEPLPPRERLAQGLGLDPEVKISLYTRRLFAGDVVVLCSGGLTGYLSEQEITRAVNRHSPEEAIKRLMSLAHERGNRDPLAISITRVLPSSVTLQPPAPIPLPPAPSWDELKNPTKPVLNNHPKPVPQTATAPMTPIRTVGSFSLKSDLRQNLEQVLPTLKESWREWGWQGYLFVVLLVLFMCGAPLLIWRYLIPDGLAAAIPFAGSAEEALVTNEDQTVPVSVAETMVETEEIAPAANVEATAMANLPPSPQPTGALVAASSNSPLATPEAASVTSVVTPTTSAVQTSTQAIADSVILTTPPTPTPPAVPTIVLPANCGNRARFFRDVTVPDGTQFAAGESFEKVWLLTNADTCPWGPGYTVRFMSGDQMGASQVIPLLDIVQPETNGEIKVPMVAPDLAGTYRGEWQLHDLAGEPFGPVMYVEIEVTAPDIADIDNADLATLYDFVANANEATWSSGEINYTPAAGMISETLELPTSEGLVMSGIAQLRGNQESAKEVLLTHPHQELGYIQGVYPVETPLQPTDTLVANLGFPKLSILSDDGVTFEVSFKPDDGSAEWVAFSKTVQYRESPVKEVFPLTNIKPGQTGTFTLRVLGGDSLNQDWAIWIDLRLVRP